MKDDPISEEARQAGQDYINQFNGDLAAVVADLQRRTEAARQAGRIVIAREPVPASRKAKTAGDA